MDIVLNFFRNSISGWTYILILVICLFFLFAAIGYLFNEKYKDDIEI